MTDGGISNFLSNRATANKKAAGPSMGELDTKIAATAQKKADKAKLFGQKVGRKLSDMKKSTSSRKTSLLRK